MEKDKKVIYPMMIALDELVKDKIYYIELPTEIKEKWIQLEKKSTNKPIYNLPTVTLKKMLNSYLEGIVDMNVVSENSDDSKWISCFKEVNIDILVNCFKIWIDEFYVKGTISKETKRKNGLDEGVKKLAEELTSMVTSDAFNKIVCEEVILFENGLAKAKEAYQLYPLKIIDSLIGKTINIKGLEAKLIYSSKNEIVTDTKVFHVDDDYSSFMIKLTVQTLPPHNKAYLNVDVSIRRWICRNSNEKGTNYIGNDKNCYIRVKDDRMQSIKTQYSKEAKRNVWDEIDIRCFKECQMESKVLGFTEVLKVPHKYNNGKVGDILIPYQEGIKGIDTSVDNGVTFIDRKIIFDFIKEKILVNSSHKANIEAEYMRKPVQSVKNEFIVASDEDRNIDEESIDIEKFLGQLDKALLGEAANIEIYADGDLKNALEQYLKIFVGGSSKNKVTICEYTDIFDELQKTSNSRRDNIPGFEIRVDEITKALDKVNTPTIAFIAIHDANYFSKRKDDDKIDIDPKKAIRAGFAETGRLTQFITFEEFEKQENAIEDKKNKAKMKNENKDNAKDEDKKKPSKKEGVNMAVEGAVLDGFRQLGVVIDYSNNKKMKGKNIVGIHICNYKKTLYGTLKPFPIIITYDVENSSVKAYCELVDNVDIPYWKAILGLSKISLRKDIDVVSKGISSTTTYRRLDRIINNMKEDVVVIIDANGTTRKFVKGISNSEINNMDKNEFNQVVRLLVSDDKEIDLTGVEKEVAIVRLRHNDEVPSYLVEEKDENMFANRSGLFKYEHVYYSLDAKTLNEHNSYKKLESKALKENRYSHRNVVEMYPMYSSGDESIAVGIVHSLRDASIQFNAQMTVLPLPLHLGSKMEEYV